ncbi:MAG: DUF4998 domain-containing protein [Niabella sp.]
MKKLLSNIIFIFSIALVAFGCTRYDEYYREYLKNGEIYYPGRIDSLSIIPGDRKGVLRLRMTTDPKVMSFKAFVRNSLSANQTVLTFPVAPGDYGKIKEYTLENLEEATYTIDIRTYASETDSSRSVTVSQFIYGQSYINTLINRSFLSFNKTDPERPAAVFAREPNLPRVGTFYPMQFTEVKYTKKDGDVAVVAITPYEEYAFLPDIATNTTVQYRTVYKPVNNSVDYFYTSYKEVVYN